MPSPTPPNATALVEVKAKQIEDLSERLGILNEVVAKRQEEAETLRHEVVATQAQISSSKRQWEREQMQREGQFKVWVAQQEESMALRTNQVSERERRAQDGLAQVEQLKLETKQQLLDVQRKRMEFATLAQDRLDTVKLKGQAEARMQEANGLFNHAQHTANQASEEMAKANLIQADCEARNLQMSNAWNKITAKEEDLRLRERDVAIREQAARQQEIAKEAALT